MRIIRLREVMELTGLARSTVYKHAETGIFPQPVPLGGRSVGWVEQEVEDWVMARIEERDAASGSAPHPSTQSADSQPI